MTRPVDALSADLAVLAGLAAGVDREAIAELRRRLEGGVFRVLVAGEAKRGKSTLVNALLGREVLPTGVVPLTAIPTTLAYADADRVDVEYADGRVQERGLDALEELVTESGNPRNRQGVAAVTLRLPAPLLAKGLELVDTPGTGSVYEHNTVAARNALGRMDAAILVLSADPPISAAERALLRELRAGAVAVFCALNKVDYLSPAEADQARRFTEEVLAAEFGRPIPVWPLSARQGLLARRLDDNAGVEGSGLGAFEATFADYLNDRQGTELARSVAGRAARLAGGIAEEAAATLAALALSGQDLQTRLAAFADRLQQVEQGRVESAALAAAEIQRLLEATNEQAEMLNRSAVRPVRQAVQDALPGLEGPLGVVEQQALDIAADRIRFFVDGWRNRHSADLDAAVQALDGRLTTRLDQHITAVRQAAVSLFNLELLPQPPAGRLVGSTGFSYLFAADPGQTEALAAAVRTHLPEALGRRRVARYVQMRAVRLLDRQVGRARADFQYRLTETRRLLLRELDRRFDAGAGRIGEAVRRASALQAERGDAAAAARAELEARLAAATALARRLSPFSGPGDDGGG